MNRLPSYVPLQPLPDDGKVRAGCHVRLADPGAYYRRTGFARTGIAMRVGWRRTRVRWTSGEVCAVPTRDLRVIPQQSGPSALILHIAT